MPVVNQNIAGDSGPVLVMVEYRTDAKNRDAFLQTIAALSHERGRDDAYAWGIYEDIATPGRMVETFYVESWLEHLRQHERVTKADRVAEQALHRLLVAPPITTHLIAANLE